MDRRDMGWVAAFVFFIFAVGLRCGADPTTEAAIFEDRALAAEAAVVTLVEQRDSVREAFTAEVARADSAALVYDSLGLVLVQAQRVLDTRIQNQLQVADSIEKSLLGMVSDSVAIQIQEIRAADKAALTASLESADRERTQRLLAETRIGVFESALIVATDLHAASENIIAQQSVVIQEWRSGFVSLRRAQGRERIVSGVVTAALLAALLLGD